MDCEDSVTTELLQRMLFERRPSSEVRSNRKAVPASTDWKHNIARCRVHQEENEVESPVTSTAHAFAMPRARVARSLAQLDVAAADYAHELLSKPPSAVQDRINCTSRASDGISTESFSRTCSVERECSPKVHEARALLGNSRGRTGSSESLGSEPARPHVASKTDTKGKISSDDIWALEQEYIAVGSHEHEWFGRDLNKSRSGATARTRRRGRGKDHMRHVLLDSNGEPVRLPRRTLSAEKDLCLLLVA